MRTEKSRDYSSFDMNFKQDFPLLFLELNVWHIERKFRSNLSICELRKVGPSHHHENVWISDKTRRCTVIRNSLASQPNLLSICTGIFGTFDIFQFEISSLMNWVFFPSLKTNWIFLPVQTGFFSKFLG